MGVQDWVFEEAGGERIQSQFILCIGKPLTSLSRLCQGSRYFVVLFMLFCAFFSLPKKKVDFRKVFSIWRSITPTFLSCFFFFAFPKILLKCTKKYEKG